jgi:hypothetical protein
VTDSAVGATLLLSEWLDTVEPVGSNWYSRLQRCQIGNLGGSGADFTNIRLAVKRRLRFGFRRFLRCIRVRAHSIRLRPFLGDLRCYGGRSSMCESEQCCYLLTLDCISRFDESEGSQEVADANG